MNDNKMGTQKVNKLIWTMGLPMILSMVLQALYNVVDTVFVINMGEEGALGNLALSAVFPVQIMMIAIGVGSGVGINALLSKCLGEGDKQAASKVVGNGLFLIVVFYVLFLLFGLFCSKHYMRLMSSNSDVIEMGTEYLSICCCISIGSIGFAIAERFLIATGKTALHIATIGYVFMGFSVAIQGILQGFREVYSPLIISAMRLIVLVLPVAYLFTLSENAKNFIWWTFPKELPP